MQYHVLKSTSFSSPQPDLDMLRWCGKALNSTSAADQSCRAAPDPLRLPTSSSAPALTSGMPRPHVSSEAQAQAVQVRVPVPLPQSVALCRLQSRSGTGG